MNFVFASLAQQEYDDAANWYEGQIRGLGERFRVEVESGLTRIEVHAGTGLSNEAKYASTC